MAQDFYDAWLARRPAHAVDADGVALAAIQGLNRKLEDQLKSKDRQIAELEERLARLEKLVSNPQTK
jgi:hypothetical protein